MNWTFAIITFAAMALFLGALTYAFVPAESRIGGRLSSLLSGARPKRETHFKEQQKERMQRALASVGNYVSTKPLSSRSQLMMIRAGIRTPEGMRAVGGIKIVLPLVFAAAALLSGLYRWNPFVIVAAAALAGYLLPEIWLTGRVRSRQHRLRLALPDALDLLVICVEAGLGLDQALLRVSEELHKVHPALSDELQLVSTEMRLGKTRTDALRELARRTGVDDIKALVAMLVQTERFGTSIAQSLRVHSDDLRMKRRQRAEEMAAKISVKMVPVLVFFIFPALMIVVIGPAVIAIARQLLKM